MCRSSLFSILFTFFLWACSGEGGTGPQATTVSVSPPSPSLSSIGETVQLTASVTDETGQPMSGVSVTWASSANDVATVSAEGLVTAVSNGTASISATSAGVDGSVTVTVQQVPSDVTVSPAADTLDAGSTLQLSCEIKDAGGTDIGSLTPTWSSSDEEVATVSSAGLVAGLAVGEVTVTASSGGATGSTQLLVVRPDMTVTGDTTFTGGTVEVDALTVGTGVTVTVTEDVVFDALGPVVMNGIIQGDCVNLTVQSADSVHITGTISTPCTTAEAGSLSPLEITADGILTLAGATIRSPGGIVIKNDPDLDMNAAAFSPAQENQWILSPGASSLRRGVASALDEGNQILFQDVTADCRRDPVHGEDGEAQGLKGYTGRPFVAGGIGTLVLDGGRIYTGPGGNGGNAVVSSSDSPMAKGGPGSDGGPVIITGGSPPLTVTSPSPVYLVLGDAGHGGDATATALPKEGPAKAPSAQAFGGDGGLGGRVKTQGAPIIIDGGEDWITTFFEGSGGRGGDGGAATATGADGADATSATPAQIGGDGSAEGGQGGLPGAGGSGRGGIGGDALATGGTGGDGSEMVFRHGAAGGDMTAQGGAGGQAGSTDPSLGGAAEIKGGAGGDGAGACAAPPSAKQIVGEITVKSDPAGSDPYVFEAGVFGRAINLMLSTQTASLGAGGNGGGGGNGVAQGGKPDPGSLLPIYAPVKVTHAGNGGNGGTGTPPGDGGAAGSREAAGSPVTTVDPSFTPGAAGPPCGSNSGLTVRVGPFLADGTATISVTGDAPWIDVEGTLNQDGTFIATGRGTMAGFSDVPAKLTGTYDEAAGTLVGDYSMDEEKIISGGHPLVYRVEAATGGG